jgi:hypothetical protein
MSTFGTAAGDRGSAGEVNPVVSYRLWPRGEAPMMCRCKARG